MSREVTTQCPGCNATIALPAGTDWEPHTCGYAVRWSHPVITTSGTHIRIQTLECATPMALGHLLALDEMKRGGKEPNE